MTQNLSQNYERNMKRGQYHVSKTPMCVDNTLAYGNNSIFIAIATSHIVLNRRTLLLKEFPGV